MENFSYKEHELYKTITDVMHEPLFLKKLGMSPGDMDNIIGIISAEDLVRTLEEARDSRGRFISQKVLTAIDPYLRTFGNAPVEGWAENAYEYILDQLFPGRIPSGPSNSVQIAGGRLFMLQFLKAVHRYERAVLPFDPTVDFALLTDKEVSESGFTEEYLQLLKLSDAGYLYEFMRLGTELTPFNTLGHIAGVHYVAMTLAYQLHDFNVPVDLALVSGAAAGHDIGKYGCRKSEEKRVPYLHYYYTDICFNRFHMPTIGHIAANHSTWDLELDNLSAESLLLIYADFRVRSSRDCDGRETVHFYTLDEAFNIILNKLDNVDAAKQHRYRRVYNKLKDFEDYMINLGADVKLPDTPAPVPEHPVPAPAKDYALLTKNQVVKELKYLSIAHNITLMNRFYNQEDFAGLLETARSEKQWRNLRTYISILGEYSTYMTERQKLMTIRFLTELLVNRESDIRNQAGAIIGQIIAHFNEEYTKELPEGVEPPKRDVTGESLWRNTLRSLMLPDYKLTGQHVKWLENSLKSIVSGILENSPSKNRSSYIEDLLFWCESEDLTEQNMEALLQAVMKIKPEYCSEEQKARFTSFAEKAVEYANPGIKVAAVSALYHFTDSHSQAGYIRELKRCLGYNPENPLSRSELSEMYLNNLKAGTPWPVKVANIRLMLDTLGEKDHEEQVLHVATHLGNLIKVSETVVVRLSAGDALVSIIDRMPLSQRNEIAVELGKGLEIGDYQFSKYIPDFLGVIMLHLPPMELDELISDLEKLLNSNNSQVASAVLHTLGVVIENYGIYEDLFPDKEPHDGRLARKNKLLGLMAKGFANYTDTISQEAFWAIGVNIFGSSRLTLKEKYDIFCRCGKKILVLQENRRESDLNFYNSAAVLKHIYRFICDYELDEGPFNIPEIQKVAFFPGTFDPFSLSHKAIAREIRDMGCEVYLALDEFSWSKKTQPRLQRRKIMSMSVSDEDDMYIFPDDIPVNIANPKDLRRLRDIFQGRELYFVAGSDVIENSSCYRKPPEEDSIHSMNHIVFRRSSDERKDSSAGEKPYPIRGSVVRLKLDEYFEDISSTRIRENIDSDRDISNLIDPVAQSYIFENSLYMREPAYKHVLQSRDMELTGFSAAYPEILNDMENELKSTGYDMEVLREYFSRDGVRMVAIRDSRMDGKTVAVAAVNYIDSIDLLSVFRDQDIAAYIRSRAAGSIAVIGGIFFSGRSSITDLGQTVLVELISELLAHDFTYIVYHPCHEAGLCGETLEVVAKQGFVNIAPENSAPIFAVDARSPVIIFKNVDTIIKHPLNKNEAVLSAVESAHDRLLSILRRIYPGELVISYNAGIMYHKIIHLLAEINSVSPVPYKKKSYGKYMAVPFGKLLEGSAVPNTVTKSLHTEKYFNRDITGFTIEESSYYSTIENQIKVIKSFDRPVILVDDLVHKGYRMNEIDPILKKNNVQVVSTVVGVQTGRGRDLMTIKNRTVESAYFLPNLKCWIDESDMYPYIGGDSIKDAGTSVSDLDAVASLNLLLPFAVPTFLGRISRENLYDFSMTCLENAEYILKTLEEEYQSVFERKLTLKRLGEVIQDPKNPDIFAHVQLDENTAPSAYVEMNIEKLKRIRKMFK